MSISTKEADKILHKEKRGKLEVVGIVEVNNGEDLAAVYTPGVAGPCMEIAKDKNKAYVYTMKGRTVAVITNGTAVLGLGNIGPEAGLPVVESKALLLKRFADVDAIPIGIDSTDPDDIVKTIKNISTGFGGIHLEDIKSPECFYIEDKLKEILDIPVYHDDQHGTAIAVLAGLYNALKIVKKSIYKIKVVINGAGASGIAVAKLLSSAGVKNLVLCDVNGALVEGDDTLNVPQKKILEVTNRNFEKGKLEEVIKNKDVFIGLSVANVLTKKMVETMNKDSIVFALANPVPEILPDEAKEAGAKVVATGRSDFPNQINNVLVFPGIFKGALEVRVKDICDEMKIAAAKGIADLIDEHELNEEHIVPSVFDKGVCEAVAFAVTSVAHKRGTARA
ncbi:NAD(P)-dependent malic enzyme [Clostridium estertheticum]|uniref:NAD(P)-dependent malic enzyme n=1 Tax=Clostridium estertheticum TaxID=238834 RepID=UPI001C7DF00C|nr:NADP-dependent malic enzyme [Clostridium estertheticum]MBX4265067.1 NADP-dependent malic enzyme [Clostridium estertheticum]MBX4268543.1 NADP-dependent malic enzyme [Clostridium estertheticum]WLC81397.1 NADP-dependent malic enzyme [Clostridium estertheticum]WLC88530.1 NADP-dependent malic enzyme [Clostridium estertheticum]